MANTVDRTCVAQLYGDSQQQPQLYGGAPLNCCCDQGPVVKNHFCTDNSECSSSDFETGLCNGAWYITHCDCGPDGRGYKDLITSS